MNNISKEKALSIVVDCAIQYKENLADKTLLFICMGRDKHVKSLEVSFDASDYLHLTRVK